MDEVKRLGLLGQGIEYSKSPFLHSFFSKKTDRPVNYRLIDTAEPLTALGMGLHGFNVTVPYKESLIGHLAGLSPKAKAIGAVNTVYQKNAEYWGHNTDYYGIQEMLSRAGMELADKRALILGSGGASKAVQACLKDLGARNIWVATRQAGPGKGGDDTTQLGAILVAYEAIDGLDYDIAINATPLGTRPNEDCPLAPGGFRRGVSYADLVYQPFLTPFLRQAVKLGSRNCDGLDMLCFQALESFELWNGLEHDPDLGAQAAIALRLACAKGLAIVGPPFSGKTSLLGRLSLPRGIRAVDLDEKIEQAAGARIPDIFRLEGEEGFRARESACLRDEAKEPAILACGGGVLTRPENLEALKDHLILFLDLPMDTVLARYRQAAAGSRPLVRGEAELVALCEHRRPMYEAAARISGDEAELFEVVREWVRQREAGNAGI